MFMVAMRKKDDRAVEIDVRKWRRKRRKRLVSDRGWPSDNCNASEHRCLGRLKEAQSGADCTGIGYVAVLRCSLGLSLSRTLTDLEMSSASFPRFLWIRFEGVSRLVPIIWLQIVQENTTGN